MDKLHYKGKGEHSVRELELIIEQQAEELHLIKSGQLQPKQTELCDNLDENYKCKNMCLTRCVENHKFYK